MPKLNIVTGVPDRVGAPVEAIKEVGNTLTQRYWAAKDNASKINTALNSMPVINKDLDDKILQKESVYIEDSFKSIKENDDWHNATGTVMDVANHVTNNSELKALQSNVAIIQNWEVEYDKRAEKEPALRLAKDFYKAKIMYGYSKQGGTVGKDGSIQGLQTFTPQSNLDIEDEKKRIEEIAGKMKAFVSTSFGGKTYVDRNDIELINDPVIKGVLAHSLESETKIETTSLSKARLEEMASNYLATDVDFNTKLRETAELSHYKNTGRFEVNSQDVSILARGIGSKFENELSATLSPTFQNTINELKHKYENNEISSAQFNKSYEKLLANQDIINEGRTQLFSQPTNVLENIYYNTTSKLQKDAIIKYADTFEERGTKQDKHYFDNHILDLLKDQTKKIMANNVSSNDIGSNTIELANSLVNPNSDLSKQYDVLDNLNKSGKLSGGLLAQYKILSNAKDNAVSIAKNRWNNIDDNERKSIVRKSWSLPGTDAYYTFTDNKISKQELIKNINTQKYNKSSQTYEPISKEEKQGIISNYVLRNINPQDLFKSNDDIYKQFSKDIALSAQGKKQLFARLDKQRYNLIDQVKDNDPEKFVVPMTVVNHTGDASPTNMNLNKNIIQSGLSGALTDINGNQVDFNALGVDISRIKDNLKSDNYNLSSFDISKAIMNGFKKDGGHYYQITYPVLDKKNDTGTVVGQKMKSIIVRYEGNESLVKQSDIEDLNSQAPRFRSPVTRSEALSTASKLARKYGEDIKSTRGLSIYDELEKIKSDKNHVASVIKVPLPDNNLEVTVTGNKGEHRFFIRNLSKGTVSPKFRVSDINDIVTELGATKANIEGMSTEVHQGIINSFAISQH